MPIIEGSISGFGSWNVPVKGSHVMIFFENGHINQPRYFATLPAIPEDQRSYSNSDRLTSKDDGFKDPDNVYPVTNRLGEPDVHRLARGVSEQTLVTTKNEQRDIGVEIALGGSWDEPESAFEAKYPHNHVIATHGGITIELDSTPNKERINIYHPSNSFIEIDSDGNMVIRNNAEKYEIVLAGKNVHIKQDQNITIDGSEKKKTGENKLLEVGGNEQIEIGGNKEETVSGNLNITVSGNANVSASTVNIEGTVNLGSQASVLELVNSTFQAIFNAHAHSGVDTGGGTSGPPTTPMIPANLTVNTKAS